MTRPEFLRGYMLLTTQPWGKAYRTGQQELGGEPSPADLQVEFYYQALEKYDAEAWQKACEVHATGDHWPSVDALKLTLKQHMPKRTALPGPGYGSRSEYVTKEEFGLNLYDTIKTIGGLLGLEQQRAAAIHQNQGYKVQGLLDRRAVLVKEWTRFRAILPHEDVKAIIARYPWVRDL